MSETNTLAAAGTSYSKTAPSDSTTDSNSLTDTSSQTCLVQIRPVDTAPPSLGVNVGRETRELPAENVGEFKSPQSYLTAVQSFSVNEGLAHIPALSSSKVCVTCRSPKHPSNLSTL